MSAELRALRAERRYADALARYQHLVAVGEADAEAHLLGGQVAKSVGNQVEARCALESALKMQPTGTILGTARFVLGTLLRDMGEIHSAIEVLSLWLVELPLYSDLAGKLQGAALYNRGLAYRCARLYGDSLRDYADACEAFRLAGQTDYLRQALQNVAWVSCILGDRVEAQEALDEARPLCAGTDAWRQQRLGEAFLESIASDFPATRRDNQHRAIELCRTIMEEGGADGPSVEVRSQASWLAGRICLRLGMIADAEGFARDALIYGAEAPSDTRCLYDAADLVREVRHARQSRQLLESGGFRE